MTDFLGQNHILQILRYMLYFISDWWLVHEKLRQTKITIYDLIQDYVSKTLYHGMMQTLGSSIFQHRVA